MISGGLLIGIGILVIAMFIGAFVIIYTRKNISQANISKSEEEAKRIVEEAKREAESTKGIYIRS